MHSEEKPIKQSFQLYSDKSDTLRILRSQYSNQKPKIRQEKKEILCTDPELENLKRRFRKRRDLFYPISTSGDKEIVKTRINEVKNNRTQRFLPFMNPFGHFVRFLVGWSQRPSNK